MNNEKLYNWIFYFNPYEQLWFAFKREDYPEFFTNRKKVRHSHSPDIEQLLEIINIIDE